MTDKSLTPKQEAFALAYVKTNCASEAYRSVVDPSETTKKESIWQGASRMLSDVKVLSRVNELQEEARERTMVTLESLTKELDEDRELARAEKQASSAISAVMGKAKLHGFLSDKIEHTGKDGGPIEVAPLSDTELAKRIAFQLMKAADKGSN